MAYLLAAQDIPPPVAYGASPWQRSQLPPELGPCTSDWLSFGDGLNLVYTDYHPRLDLLENSDVERAPSLTLTICLQGHSSTGYGSNQRLDFAAGFASMNIFASMRGQRRFPQERRTRQLRLIADAAVLERYALGHLLQGERSEHPVQQLAFAQYSAAARRLADSLVHLHSHHGSVLDCHIAALSLLAEQARPLAQPVARPGALPAAEQDQLLRVREILLTQFDRPLTMAYLCTLVGTNECKLKQGFRTQFGTSPRRMLTSIRMHRAWELLETGLHVSTVAYRVGYQHLSSFSAAFQQFYGRNPKSVTKGQQVQPLPPPPPGAPDESGHC